MAVRPLTEQEKQAAPGVVPPEPTDPDQATYGHADGESTYRGKPLNEETARADHHAST